ncbi:penicillin-binding protein [Rugosimonospora africana]|uniref:Penicillin-binding protein n=1 Tax=Rugosimonospora africana TaxID=556532 RepID=A0A8J3QXP2_9ACTN|nr:transglycosylase domain-containing protein [Rugosimonospora africana]GIH18209.1 penicillin-binding protein [Rugosimonospora africana]
MRIRDRNPLSNATALLICGLLAGVVVAAAAFPAVAMSGLAAKAGADGFDSLPTELTVAQSPQVSYLYASDHKTLIAAFYDENRRDVTASQIAPVMLQAIVSAEDMRFYQHHGVDVKGVARAMVANQKSGETEQGASTLTMQYVRQAIEYSASTPQEVVDATSDTPGRKLREMKIALSLEKKLTKQQILDRYLNIAPFGNGAYGIYAAAEVYFNETPDKLTLDQAALLAGLVKAPTAFDPVTTSGRPQSLLRRTYVLNNMVKMGYITQAQANTANKAELKLADKSTPNGCTSVVKPEWGFFCDYFYRWWLQQPAFGADEYERAEHLKTGGYSIYASLDVGAQADAMKNVNTQAKGLPKKSDALMVAGVEPGTGHIKVMAVNRTYSNDQSGNGLSTDPHKHGQKGNYPNTTVPLLGAPDQPGGYQFGSTFKMFTMLTALQQGVPLSRTIDTTNPYKSHFIVGSGPAACPGTNYYCPTNDSKDEVGPYNMWTGFGASINTYFVPLEEQVGAQNVVAMAQNLGITFSGNKNTEGTDAYFATHGADQWGAFTLGVAAVSPLEMANAYAAVAADGNYCEPLPVDEIHEFNGTKLDAGNPRCRQAVDPDVARAATDAARCPVGDQGFYGGCNGHATASPTRSIVPHKYQIAGKTGTTDNDRTAALITMTKQLAVAGIVADPDNSDTHGYSHTQVNLAVQHTLADYMQGKPAVNFTKETEHTAYGQRQSIPSVKCQSPNAATTRLENAGFAVHVGSKPVASSCPAGTVASTTPSGSTSKGGPITLNISAGPGGQQNPPPGQGTGQGNPPGCIPILGKNCPPGGRH